MHSNPTISLDKLKFNKKVACCGLKVSKNDTNKIKSDKRISPYLLKDQRIKNVVEDPDGDNHKRIILLSSTFTIENLPNDFVEYLNSCNIHLMSHFYTTGYDELSYTEILRELLPNSIEVPSAFERVGHIAHLNLTELQLPYKHLIGSVILDKHKGIKTVVNKIASLTSVFRTPELDLIAGEDKLTTQMIENGLSFYIDYKNVYWNSRLSGEREVLTESIPSHSLICDVMSGVGAFAMYLAKKKHCLVLANDLNPSATQCIQINAHANKVDHLISIHNIDGREFISHCLNSLNVLNKTSQKVDNLFLYNKQLNNQHTQLHSKSNILEQSIPGQKDLLRKIPPIESSIYTTQKIINEESNDNELHLKDNIEQQRDGIAKRDSASTTINTVGNQRKKLKSDNSCEFEYKEVHFLLNLPQKAIEFLDSFISVMASPSNIKTIIHCYCFAHPDMIETDIYDRIRLHMNGELPKNITLREVRNVAPNKRMYCIEFLLSPVS